MKTEKWKVLIIKNPFLKRLRTNLRTILVLAIYERFEELLKLGISRTKLINSHSTSILNCSSGSACVIFNTERKRLGMASLEDDMVWNPIDKNWICLNCYEEYFGTERLKKAYLKFIKKYDDAERSV